MDQNDRKLEQYINDIANLFNYYPQKSKLFILDNGQWGEVCNEYGFEERGSEFYIPRDYICYLHSDQKEDELIRRIAHGFVGHGSFCEYSKIGEEFVGLNKEVADIEKEIFGKVLKLSERILILSTNLNTNLIFDLRKTEDRTKAKEFVGENLDQYDTVALLEEISFSAYESARQKNSEFKKRNEWLYEGFARWMEEQTLEWLGFTEKKEWLIGALKRKELLYSDYYLKLKEIETKEGWHAVLRTAGFNYERKPIRI